MHGKLQLGMACMLAVSCGTPTPAPTDQDNHANPQAAPEIVVDPRYRGFSFAPTLSAFRPENSDLVPIAEMGDATKRSMKAVVAYYAHNELSVALWVFELQGEKDTLAPLAPPTPLLPLKPSDKLDRDALATLRTQMAAPRSVVTRPQGLEATSAERAISQLREAANTAQDQQATPADRLQALATFCRGLGDEVLFSARGLADALQVIAATTELNAQPTSSKRRVSLRTANGTELAMFDKRDGWVLEHIS